MQIYIKTAQNTNMGSFFFNRGVGVGVGKGVLNFQDFLWGGK